ncbi:MAG: hypothetical protein HY099_04765 [Nitrospirae bacterium]|nr:hypothetical protein [Nitrospirota bacterium]
MHTGRLKKFIYCTCLIFLVSGCGYTLQTRANLPFDTIAVGTIENKTLEPKLQDRFNRALAETFAEYGFNVSSSARYRLEGKITSFDLRPMVEQQLTATQYEVIIKANFRLVDTESGSVTHLAADSPFITYFGSSGALESVMAQKELSTYTALKNLSQELVRLIAYNTPKDFALLLLNTRDIKDTDSLVLKLRDPKDPLSKYLREQFSSDTRRLIDGYDRFDYSAQAIKGVLVNELNQVLNAHNFYDKQRFAHITLTEETQLLIRQNPKGMERIRLNRLLLEEAYPDEIAKSRKPPEEKGKERKKTEK